MNSSGWRIVLINPSDNLSLSNEQLIVMKEDIKTSIPIEQISLLLICSSTGSISLPVLEKLVQSNISVIFCDKSQNPIGELLPININHESAGKLIDQIKWTGRRKNAVWNIVVKAKIKNQINLLSLIGNDVPDKMYEYVKDVKNGDVRNREATAAKVYFASMFGDSFIRYESDNINSALNYGYTILRNAFSRTLIAYGYNPALGIHHSSRQNCFNLSSDLMEPFRPYIDRIVYENGDRILDSEYKKELISVLQSECRYGKRIIDFSAAIDTYVLDVVRYLNTGKPSIEELSFD